MYGILVSALFTAIAAVAKQAFIKFSILFALYFVIAAFINNLAEFVSGRTACCTLSFSSMGLSNALSGLPAAMWYFLDLFAFSQGACIVVTAFVYRFLIRRLPVIG